MSVALYGLIASAFGFVNFAVHAAFLIVTLTAVRSRRPDAFLPFTMGAVLLVLQTVLNLVATPLIARLPASASGNFGSFTILFSFGTILSTIAWTLLMIGLVKIASPPREQNFNRAPGDY